MGFGSYSSEAHEALMAGRRSLRPSELFVQTGCHPLMNPKGVKVRESRDSEDHPQSLGIVFALDVTGSMGDIPYLLASSTLPEFMRVLEASGVVDPQVLFMAVGDATCDRAPLQVGQFESTAELMDQWLTWSFLEGGGGGSHQESYELALYFLALHTQMDCVEKRKKKGYLFMTGDEKPYPDLSRHVVEGVIGDRLEGDLRVEEVVAKLSDTFEPFFIVPDRPRRTAQGCEGAWRNLLGDHVLCLEAPEDICYVAAGALLLSEGTAESLRALEKRLLAAGMPKGRWRAVGGALRELAGSPRLRR